MREIEKLITDILIGYLADMYDPKNLIKRFSTDEEFKDWCRKADTAKPLNDVLQIFEREELYEHCKLIKEVIDEFEANGGNPTWFGETLDVSDSDTNTK